MIGFPLKVKKKEMSKKVAGIKSCMKTVCKNKKCSKNFVSVSI
jgi:hypothetical protein